MVKPVLPQRFQTNCHATVARWNGVHLHGLAAPAPAPFHHCTFVSPRNGRHKRDSWRLSEQSTFTRFPPAPLQAQPLKEKSSAHSELGTSGQHGGCRAVKYTGEERKGEGTWGGGHTLDCSEVHLKGMSHAKGVYSGRNAGLTLLSVCQF